MTRQMKLGLSMRYLGYHDAAYNALFAQYQAARDPAERHKLSVALQEMLADDEPNVFLFSAPRTSVSHPLGFTFHQPSLTQASPSV